MDFNIHESWKPYVADEFQASYFSDLTAFIQTEYKSTSCYPPKDQIFNAFNLCHFEDVKVVIIGQDPYHGAGQANGLCFSVNKDIPHPPSLKNIFKEIESQLNQPYPESGDLSRWANQGVLLLNATLTVRAHNAGSHQKKGWEQFTDAVIRAISQSKKDVVFLLWGGFAKKKVKWIDTNKHHVLTSGHPSPLSANRGYWFGNTNFLDANAFLKAKGLEPIIW